MLHIKINNREDLFGCQDLSEARIPKCLFLLKDIESNWDCGRLTFIWNGDQEKYQCIILEESLLKERSEIAEV